MLETTPRAEYMSNISCILTVLNTASCRQYRGSADLISTYFLIKLFIVKFTKEKVNELQMLFFCTFEMSFAPEENQQKITKVIPSD